MGRVTDNKTSVMDGIMNAIAALYKNAKRNELYIIIFKNSEISETFKTKYVIRQVSPL